MKMQVETISNMNILIDSKATNVCMLACLAALDGCELELGVIFNEFSAT